MIHIQNSKLKYSILNFVLILLFIFVNPICFAEDKASIENIYNQDVNLKITEEAITSLAAQLSKEQFDLVKDKVVGQAFSQLDLSVLSNRGRDHKTPKLFTKKETEKVHHSLKLYFDILSRINKVAPLIDVFNKAKIKQRELEDTLDDLMKDEKVSTEKELANLKVEIQNYRNSFKAIAHQFELQSINFNKLPGMLTDLGYDDSFFEVMHSYLSEYIGIIKKVEAAKSIIESLEEVSNNIDQTEEDLKAAQAEEEKLTISQKLKELLEHKKMLQRDFTLDVTGIDTNILDEENTREINIEEELTKIFSPLVVGLTEFTEPSRRIEFLRSTIAYYEQHTPEVHKGIEQIDVLLTESEDKKVKENLLKEKDFWVQQEKEFRTKLEVAKQQLIELQNRKLSPVEAFEHFIQAVLSQRGLNIIFSIFVFFLSLIIFLLLRRLILLINPFNYIQRLRFIANFIDVFLYFLAFAVATLAMMIALYAAGEVLALAIVVIILMGIAWTLRNILPLFVGQIRLLLGYGAVRRNERIIYEQIPWLVESIGIFCYLRNPLLTGGVLRLPIKDLLNMRSRPYDEKETWFPCKEGDYVLINHKDWRKVIIQTPQRIKLDWFGMEETMPTSTFLMQKVFNLSDTPFWVGINFYIAYQHRFEIMDEIVKNLSAFLEEEFKKLPFGEHLMYPWVDFSKVTDTSLGVMAWVQMKPEAAFKYNAAKLRLTQICFRAANKYGWEIIRFHNILQHQLNEIKDTPQILEI